MGKKGYAWGKREFEIPERVQRRWADRGLTRMAGGGYTEESQRLLPFAARLFRLTGDADEVVRLVGLMGLPETRWETLQAVLSKCEKAIGDLMLLRHDLLGMADTPSPFPPDALMPSLAGEMWGYERSESEADMEAEILAHAWRSRL